jgi:hypothetical protein
LLVALSTVEQVVLLTTLTDPADRQRMAYYFNRRLRLSHWRENPATMKSRPDKTIDARNRRGGMILREAAVQTMSVDGYAWPRSSSMRN